MPRKSSVKPPNPATKAKKTSTRGDSKPALQPPEQPKLSLEASPLLDTAIASLTKKYGKASIVIGDNHEYEEVDRISTGHFGIDEVFGGGVPRGRMIEIYGGPSSGKTTLALQAIASAQKQGLQVAYIDVEHTVQPQYAELLGVNWKNVLSNQPDSGEEAMDVLKVLAQTGQVGLVVLDSVAALATRRMLEGEVEDEHMAEVARLMSKECTKLNLVLRKSNTGVIFINQIRSSLAKFGSDKTTPGGQALRFYASIRAELIRYEAVKGRVKGEELVVGQKDYLTTIKNKCGPAYRKISVELRYPTDLGNGQIQRPGFDHLITVIDAAVDQGIIQRNKTGYFTFEDGTKMHGLETVRTYFLENQQAMSDLLERVST